MSIEFYKELRWLPKKPDDFAAQCKAALETGEDVGEKLQSLARFALDINDLNRLSNLTLRVKSRGHSLNPLSRFRLGIVSNATTHLLVPVLHATALRYGFDLEIVEADYGQLLQESLSPNSKINTSRPECVLIAIDHHGLPIQTSPGDQESASQTISGCISFLNSVRGGLRANGTSSCIVQTIARPLDSLFGSLDFVLPGTQRSLIDSINRGIADSLKGSSDLLFDVAGLAETVGLASWNDPTQWNVAKLPFAIEYIPLYADHVCRILSALRGKSRRCLILDLDNTVWGGVIGDDGLEGIVLGQGDGTGEAFLSVQRAALELRSRGVVLAVSSKNSDEIARQPFRKHPDMLLREDHIAVFQANWNDKATNIKAIAEELSLGIASMAFLDDNPAERGLVRQILPQVGIPELPEDPALFARALQASGYFEAISFSIEDRHRADFYQDNARRIALQQQAGDVNAYLESLRMEISFSPFDEVGIPRITQLISKSNQYNLTTRRYTEAEVRAIQMDPQFLGLQVRLSDIFGDNGMVSVVICKRVQNTWLIDTWLMSCRVLNRKVEFAILMELIDRANAIGVKEIHGSYKPTSRNALVKDHYERLGFELAKCNEDGSSDWKLDVATVPRLSLPMAVRGRSATAAKV